MLIRWCPLTESSRFSSLVTMCASLAAPISYPLTSHILMKYNWESVFYFIGLISIVWCFLWFSLVSDDPVEHNFISEQERTFILVTRSEDAEQQASRIDVPVLKIVKSIAVWSILIISVANDYGVYLLTTEVPSFISKVLEKDIETVIFF